MKIYAHSLFLFEPLNVTAIFPNPNFCLPLIFYKNASSMLLAVTPLAIVDTTVFPSEDSMAFPLVIDEFSLVLLAIFPFQDTLAVHFVFLPLSFINFRVWPHIPALSRNFVHKELTCVNTAICKG